MIESLPWTEWTSDPERILQLLEEKERELQRELFRVRQEVKQVRQVLKVMHTVDGWRASGIPEQRQPETTSDDPQETNANGFQAPTRKARILALLSQDPLRHWKVFDVANALDEVPKIKSVRVAMDELAKAGSLAKLPNAYYQFTQLQQA
ncbi:hypothetical protein [Streptomyces sp. NBC_01794]|uniref:hypothetical protein n=1 Tax=Streptomyces sp. NBC_01794 TaxID=2975942 RepID=UPI003088A843|nr:hypothetical protein OIE54_21730 [Streptomyces sp. NBC_01794]